MYFSVLGFVVSRFFFSYSGSYSFGRLFFRDFWERFYLFFILVLFVDILRIVR